MGGVRITAGIMVDRVLHNLNNQSRRIIDLQTQLATGLRVNAPSDDPIDARRAINTREAIARTQQYIDNIASAKPRLAETDTSLQSTSSNILRLRELTTQGANGTNDQTALNAIAAEVNQILESVVATANHQTGSIYIFGGTRTLAPPFDVTRDVDGNITAVTYVGNSEYSSIAVGDGAVITQNEPGDDVFQSSVDIFQSIIDIRDNLLAGDQASLQNQRLAELETARQQLGQAQARVGAIQNRVDRAELDLQDFISQLQELLSDSVDADFAEVIINLNSQENAFQAALNAAGRVIQPSLLDFLR